MPTVLDEAGYKVKIYTHDHLPPHVHVYARGCEAIINLGCSEENVSLRQNFRFTPRELNAIGRIVEQYKTLLCKIWEELHGVFSARDQRSH